MADAIQLLYDMLRSVPGAKLESNRWKLSLSPLGYPEVFTPDNKVIVVGNKAFGGITQNVIGAISDLNHFGAPSKIIDLLQRFFSPGEPTVTYSGTPSPQTMNHERIHVGHQLSGWEPKNKYEEPIEFGLYDRMLQELKMRGILFDPSPAEVPAYSFEDPQNYNKEDFSDYMDMMRRYTWGGNPIPIEASMPIEMMRAYLSEHPHLIPPRPQLQFVEDTRKK